jgi:hypothetical protein
MQNRHIFSIRVTYKIVKHVSFLDRKFFLSLVFQIGFVVLFCGGRDCVGLQESCIFGGGLGWMWFGLVFGVCLVVVDGVYY